MKASDVLNLYVLEYSPSQKCFHIDSLETAIETNLRQLKDGHPSDWALVGVTESREEAHKMIDMIKNQLMSDELNEN
jgi:hypothetical protein